MFGSVVFSSKRLILRDQLTSAKSDREVSRGRVFSIGSKANPVTIPEVPAIWRDFNRKRPEITGRKWSCAPKVPAITTTRARACLKNLYVDLERARSFGFEITSLDLSPYASREKKKLSPERIEQLLSYTTNCFKLNLSGCVQFKDELAGSIGFSVEKLNLSGCKEITALVGSFFQLLSSLKSLDISNCPKITGYIFVPLSFQTKLRHLNIKGCKAIELKDVNDFIKKHPKCAVEHDFGPSK